MAVSHRLLARAGEVACLGAVLLHHGNALCWVARSWRDATYESWGVLVVLMLLPALLRPPPRRAEPSLPHLAGLCGLALLDLLLLRLRLNILSALLAVLSLHLWAVAFRVYPGRWWAHRQLWLGLLALPAVFWVNLLVGFPLQQLATRVAGAGLSLYGLPVSVSGTLLELPGATVVVDSACSGVKLLHGGVLFGLLAAPSALGRARRSLFWAALLGGLFLANAARVMCLALAQLELGRPLSETAHQAVGLVAFLVVAAASLLILGRRTSPVPPLGVRAAGARP